jgi:hypothetical protein
MMIDLYDNEVRELNNLSMNDEALDEDNELNKNIILQADEMSKGSEYSLNLKNLS